MSAPLRPGRLRLRWITVLVADLGKQQASHSEHAQGVAFRIATVPHLMPARIPERKARGTSEAFDGLIGN